jgi:hypothetical protein
VSRSLGAVGVPTSAGAFAPGQEQAPRALRGTGLLESLRHLGATSVTGVATKNSHIGRWRHSGSRGCEGNRANGYLSMAQAV